MLCQGRTRTYIAAELGLSPNTVKGYIHNVYQKSGSVDKQDLLDRVELFIEKH
ncbi:helix-turn-helix transcriptional regulator [Gordonibacter sp.]|uniref:helix-turn-helix transcriptional regulator n=1 Tax=Gordonibacter sp. TaxID=1968902 RepID=UPI002FC9FC2D